MLLSTTASYYSLLVSKGVALSPMQMNPAFMPFCKFGLTPSPILARISLEFNMLPPAGCDRFSSLV